MTKIKKITLLLALALLSAATVFSQVSVSIYANIAPPMLPVYEQPMCPGDGYIWTPGYWAYDNVDGYYWVPGVWVMPPQYGYLWTPCYWGYANGVYGFYGGYWGPHVGYYGGVNYGYGYGGVGYGGGRWEGHTFRYNTAVTNVNAGVIHNTYVDRSVARNSNSRASFNGPGGTTARPTQQEQVAMREKHVQPTSVQMTHQQTAGKDQNQFAKVNHGKPATAAMNSVGGQRFSATGKPATVAPGAHTQGNQQHSSAVQQAHQQPQQARQQPQQARQQPQQAHQQPQQARQQPQQARPQPQQARPQPQQARQQPQQARQQPQQARQQPQQFHQQPQQARPQPQQARQQPQQTRQQPQETHSEGRPEGGGHERR